MNPRKGNGVNLLLVHVPKFLNFYNPIGHFTLGNLLPAGLLPIGAHAEKSGYRARILHLGIERLSDPGFRLRDEVGKSRPLLVGFSLHWHYQLFDVIEEIKALKNRFPDLPVVLGGITASVFPEEILREHPEADFVIRGEAEEPVLRLLSCLASGSSLDSVPNLSRRRGGAIVHNPISFVADPEFLSDAVFHRYDLLKNANLYFGDFNHILRLLDASERRNRSVLHPGSTGHLVLVGRGCPVSCSYCGGAKEAAAKTSGRTGVSLRTIESVVAELKEIGRQGIKRLYFPYDPYPHSDYYPRLFDRMFEEGLRFGAAFESFGLPTHRFLDSFEKTFGASKENRILLTVETGDEELRGKNRGYAFSNNELFECLDSMKTRGLYFHLSYSLGLPGETAGSLDATKRLWNRVHSRFRRFVRQQATLINLDPGSLAETNPEKWDVRVEERTLGDLIELHRRTHLESLSAWGHLPVHHECPALISEPSVTGHRLTEKILLRYKCRHFCPYTEQFHVGYPFNRAACAVSGVAFRTLGGLRGTKHRFDER